MKLYKRFICVVTTVLLFLFSNLFMISPIKAAPGLNQTSDTIVKPVFINIGNIEDESPSCNVLVYNNGDRATFNAKVEGKGKEFISFYPEAFELEKGESKEVKVQINNKKELTVGPYDLSIAFLSTNSSTKWISAKTTTTLRLKFCKVGISIASINVTDVGKSKTAAFNVIFANFTSEKKTLDTVTTILSKEDNSIIGEFRQRVIMNPYPIEGFYGTIKIPWSTKDIKMGNYIFKVSATGQDGTSLFNEKEFIVGELKGKLIKLSGEDTHRSNPVKLTAQVKNIGNIDLPTIFNVVINNKSGEKVFEGKKQIIISPRDEQLITIECPTTNVPLGTYTAEYSIKMGNDTVTDTLQFNILRSYKEYVIEGTLVFIFILSIYILVIRRKNIKK